MKKSYNLKLSLLRLAVVSAMPFVFTSPTFAACVVGTGAITNECSGDTASGNVTVTNTTTYVDVTGADSTTRAVGGSYTGTPATTAPTQGVTLLQFDGHGRTLTVEAGGLVENFRNIDGARTAVSMGQTTISPSSSKTFSTFTTDQTSVSLVGSSGISASVAANTTVSSPAYSPTLVLYSDNGVQKTGTLIKIADAPVSSHLGQSLVFGRYDTVESDFYPGTSFKIVAIGDSSNKFVLVEGQVSASSFGSGSSSFNNVYGILSNYGETVTKTYDTTTALGKLFALGDGERFNDVEITGTQAKIKFTNVISNSGTIASRVQSSEIASNWVPILETNNKVVNGAYNATIKAITTTYAGDYLIENNSGATIGVSHAGIGAAYGIEAGGTVTSLSISNAGTISATRSLRIAPTDIKNNLAWGNSTGQIAGPFADVGLHTFAATNYTVSGVTTYLPAGVAVGLVNAINTQEELETLNIYNASTGVIGSYGDYTGTIMARAAVKNIVNDGTIEHVSGAGGSDYTKGFAIGSPANGSATAVDTRILNLTNNGTINGAVLASNANPLRYYLLSTIGTVGVQGGVTYTGNIAQGLNDRLDNSSYYGQTDSTIDNSSTGHITGDLYFQNGTHILSNAGIIAGNIDLDQRNSYGKTVSATQFGTLVGTKDFTFENTGTYTGNIQIFTANSGDVESSAKFVPTINGAGGASAAAANTSNINYFNGNLSVISTNATGGNYATAAGGDIDENVTITPKVASGVVVKDGDYYKVANAVYFGRTLGTLAQSTTSLNPTKIPGGASNGLVTWETSLNSANALVVRAEVNPTGVTGLLANSQSALTALMSADSELGSQVQNLASAEDVRKASEQLRPEVNGAMHQVSMNVTDKVFGLVGSRLDEVHLASIAGRSGIATGDQTRTADGTGVWFQGFGAKGSQDRRVNTDGYNTQAYGFAVGADQLIDEETRVGLVGSYGQSTVNGLGDGVGNRTSIDSYQGAIYGSTLLRKLYVNGTLGLGYHDYSNNRFVLANSIKGSHDAWQYSAKVDVGYPINMRAVTLVPVASMAYSHLAESGYSESGVGALAISDRDTDSFRTGLGAKAMIPLLDSAVSAGLELRAIWNHEFGDASIDTTARFVDGGASFTTNGVSLERDSANLGASLRLSGIMDGVKQSLNVNYDAEVKSQYINQTASLQARFDF